MMLCAYSSVYGVVYFFAEGGRDIPVTWENRHEFVRLVEEYRSHTLLALSLPCPLAPTTQSMVQS
jgi:hypothetical protein